MFGFGFLKKGNNVDRNNVNFKRGLSMSEMDEKKLAENGIELTSEDQLELVTGGARGTTPKPKRGTCNSCGKTGWKGQRCSCGGTFG